MDTLRGAAVLLVVLAHAVELTPGGAPRPLVVVDLLLEPFRVPALMLLSGLLLPRSLARPKPVYLAGKVSRILWPYLVWSVVVLAVTSFGTPGPDPWVELFVNPRSAMWFVGYLFVFYVVALLCRPAVRTALLVPTFVALVLVGGTASLDPFAPEQDVALHRVFFTFFCFLSGDVLARHATRWLGVLTGRWGTVACVLLALPAAGCSLAGLTVRYQPLFLPSTLAGIVAAIPAVTWLSRRSVGRFLAAQGRSSLVFYVTHWPVQLVTWHLALAAGLVGVGITAANLVAALVVGLVAVAARRRLAAVDLLFDLHLERRSARLRTAPVDRRSRSGEQGRGRPAEV